MTQLILERFTTISGITPEEVHQIGLDEVKQLRQKMTALATKLGFQNLTFKNFTEQMKNNQSQLFKRFHNFLSLI